MKDPTKLQQKLKSLLSKSKLRIGVNFDRPWDDLVLKEIAWVVQDHVNRSHEVVEDDNELRDWLDEYKFFTAARTVNRTSEGG